MELTLHYNRHAGHPPGGAFIRGHEPAAWLREMNSWQIPLEPLVCLVIAQNNQPTQVAGLFVVFQGQVPNQLLITQPYGVLGGKLFIPADADLLPQVSEQELQSLLIWDYQVFHPSLGFIGFEQTDRMAVRDLLQFTAAHHKNWSLAHAGLPPWEKLQQIHLQPVTTDDIFEALKETYNNKPLSDIPHTTQGSDSPLQNILNKLLGAGLQGGATVIGGILSALGGAAGAGAGSASTGGASSGAGLLSKLSGWIEQKLEYLQKKRDTELKRLSDLFDANSDEALQYAIPLGGRYYNRGEALPSSQLSRRSTEFNINKLGGGQSVDGWNVNSYYEELRNKYLKAAEKAMADKDYKKAAYIYAHLLGDYGSAAHALKQGKHFREAALLYKEHLNNVPEAASCLEQGGLLQEAIELYISIDKYEKAGDLYTILGQKEQAMPCYETCVEKAAANNDYLDQARIIAEKIGDAPRAKNVLLRGWHDVKQPEACLTKYFALVADGDTAHLPHQVQTIYNKELLHKKTSFLNVISKVNKQYPSAELNNTCNNIAYEIISEQVSEGNENSLLLLKDFVTNDQLIAPDCNRFIHSTRYAPKLQPGATSFTLTAGIHWKIATPWRNELLIWGTQPTGLFLARMNRKGHIQYITWNTAVDSGTTLLPVTDAEQTNLVIVHAGNLTLDDKILAADNHFNNELLIKQPSWLRGNLIAMALVQNEVVVLHREKTGLFITYYASEAVTLSNQLFQDNEPFYIELSARPQEMFHWYGSFYMHRKRSLLRISRTGQVEEIQVNANIQKMGSTIIDDCLHIALYTDEGCTIVYSQSARWHSMGNFFARNAGMVTDIQFISNKHLAITFNRSIHVYELSRHSVPVNVFEVVTDFIPLAVFRTGTRNQFGILSSYNQIKLYDIENEV